MGLRMCSNPDCGEHNQDLTTVYIDYENELIKVVFKCGSCDAHTNVLFKVYSSETYSDSGLLLNKD